MSNIEEHIDVEVPVSTAYNQWTQFEEFPKFMKGVESIRQIDDKTLHWTVSIGGVKREFEAEITEQHPDHRIAWQAKAGHTSPQGEGRTKHAGVVTFHRLDDAKTRVMLQLDTEPTDVVEKAGDLLGVLKRQVTGDLDRFKEMIEARGTETGAWRGEVEEPPTA